MAERRGDPELNPRPKVTGGRAPGPDPETGGAVDDGANPEDVPYEQMRDQILEEVDAATDLLVEQLKAEAAAQEMEAAGATQNQPPGQEPPAYTTLSRAVEAAQEIADQALLDLNVVIDNVNSTMPGPDLEVIKTQHRVKTADSLIRAYALENAISQTSAAEFLRSHTDDLIRFSVVVPVENYSGNVNAVLSDLADSGYTVASVKSFWRTGNRYPGLNITLTNSSGTRMEVQFPTPAAAALSDLTHRDYQVLRLPGAVVAARVEAFGHILEINRRAGVDQQIPDTSTLEIPVSPGRDQPNTRPIDNSPERWFTKHSEVGRLYRNQLSKLGPEGRSIAERLETAGFSEEVRTRLARAIEGAIQDAAQPPDLLRGDRPGSARTGEPLHPGAVSGTDQGDPAASSDEDVDVRPDDGSSPPDGRLRPGGRPGLESRPEAGRGDSDTAEGSTAERSGAPDVDERGSRPPTGLSEPASEDVGPPPRQSGGKDMSDSPDESTQRVLGASEPHPSTPRPYAETRAELLTSLAERTANLIETIPQESIQKLWDAVAKAGPIADEAMRDLSDVAQAWNRANGTSIELAGTEFRVKPTSSLARKYAIANNVTPQNATAFAETVDDLVRFSALIPEIDYGKTVLGFLAALAEQGYALQGDEPIVNLWKAGNLFHGLSVKLVHEASGQLIELQFPTRASYVLGKATHPDYEIYRFAFESVAKRVEAIAHYVLLNLQADIDGRLPDTTGLPEAQGNGPDKFFDAEGEMSRYYRAQVRQRGMSVARHLANAGFPEEIQRTINDAVKGDSKDGQQKSRRGRRAGRGVRERAGLLPSAESGPGSDGQPVRGAGVDGVNEGSAPESSDADVDVRSGDGPIRVGRERSTTGEQDQGSGPDPGRGDSDTAEGSTAERSGTPDVDERGSGTPPGLNEQAAKDGRRPPRQTGGRDGSSESTPEPDAEPDPLDTRTTRIPAPPPTPERAFRHAYRTRTMAGFARNLNFADAVRHARDQLARLAAPEVFATLSDEEVVAIQDYTTNSQAISEAIRSGDPSRLAPFAAQIQLITSGLNRLPAHVGPVHRHIYVPASPERATTLSVTPEQVSDRYQVGDIVTEPGPVSTDVNPHVAQADRVLFEIHSHTGRLIQPLSSKHNEEVEVLFAPGSQFQVVDKVRVDIIEDGQPTGRYVWKYVLNDVSATAQPSAEPDRGAEVDTFEALVAALEATADVPGSGHITSMGDLDPAQRTALEEAQAMAARALTGEEVPADVSWRTVEPDGPGTVPQGLEVRVGDRTFVILVGPAPAATTSDVTQSRVGIDERGGVHVSVSPEAMTDLEPLIAAGIHLALELAQDADRNPDRTRSLDARRIIARGILSQGAMPAGASRVDRDFSVPGRYDVRHADGTVRVDIELQPEVDLETSDPGISWVGTSADGITISFSPESRRVPYNPSSTRPSAPRRGYRLVAPSIRKWPKSRAWQRRLRRACTPGRSRKSRSLTLPTSTWYADDRQRSSKPSWPCQRPTTSPSAGRACESTTSTLFKWLSPPARIWTRSPPSCRRRSRRPLSGPLRPYDRAPKTTPRSSWSGKWWRSPRST